MAHGDGYYAWEKSGWQETFSSEASKALGKGLFNCGLAHAYLISTGWQANRRSRSRPRGVLGRSSRLLTNLSLQVSKIFRFRPVGCRYQHINGRYNE